VGEGPLRAGLESQACSLGLAGRITFTGRREDARSIIAAADLLVLSSLEEGMPNVIIEALAAGVPQVATAVGGTPETLEEGGTGFLVPPGDPVMLSARILKILGDGELRDRMARRSRALFQERFGVERMSRRHEELYQEALGEGAGS
jgi:glycosyltransferase involved in cell wall biosynthesis